MSEPGFTPPTATPGAAPRPHPLLRVAAYLLTFLLIQPAVGFAVHGFLLSPEAVLLVSFLTAVPMVEVTRIFLRFLDHRSFASLGVRWPAGGPGRARRELVTLPLGVAALVAGWLLGILALPSRLAALHLGGLSRDLALGRPWWPLPAALLFPGLLAAFLLQAGAEELMIRGYVYRALRERWRPGSAALASSVLFSLLHAANPAVSAVSLVNIVLAGLVLAALVERSGSLWGATLAHGAWNFTVACLVSLPVSGFSLFHLLKLSLTGERQVTGGGFGPEGSLVLTALGLPLAAALWWRLARNRSRPREDTPLSAAEDGAPATPL
jgi:membrane protease YdiL (CAAX protease family)